MTKDAPTPTKSREGSRDIMSFDKQGQQPASESNNWASVKSDKSGHRYACSTGLTAQVK